MLLYKCNLFNGFNQIIYQNHINSINLALIECPKCHEIHVLSFYGTYRRSFYTDYGKITIHAQRCICSNCNSTHSILPSFTIPYSSVSLPDACDIISSDDIDDIMIRLSISIDTIRRIRSRFSLWIRLVSNYNEFSLFNLTSICVSKFNLQFLQTRSIFISIIPT